VVMSRWWGKRQAGNSGMDERPVIGSLMALAARNFAYASVMASPRADQQRNETAMLDHSQAVQAYGLLHRGGCGRGVRC